MVRTCDWTEDKNFRRQTIIGYVTVKNMYAVIKYEVLEFHK